MKKLTYLLPLVGLMFINCSKEDPVDNTNNNNNNETVTYTSGSADFSKYVALGNSLTAGFSDGALFIEGQTNSFPNLLANQFALAGGGEFKTPFMADNLGGATLGGTQILSNRMILSFASGSPNPTVIPGSPGTEIAVHLDGPFNNMGVPGAKSYHLLAPGYGNVQGVALGLANPFYARFASSGTSTVIADAASQIPSFYSMWIGSNDVLGYAMAGGAAVNQAGNLNPATYGGSDISDPNVVAGAINGMVQALGATGAKGVIANIPDVTGAPFFTTVPHNPIPLDAATAAAVNQAYAAYNGGLQAAYAALNAAAPGLFTAEEVAARTISFEAGLTNAVVILDESLTNLGAINPAFAALPQIRQATADDLLVLTSKNVIGTLADPSNPLSVNGVAIPLADKWVLTPAEQTEIATAITAINANIAGIAQANGLALVDTNAFFNNAAANGVAMSDGSVLTTTYGSGGLFSLDGIHPSPRGNAVITNLFIKAINAKYGSDLPEVEPLAYKALYLQ
jgi:lysophospholipase L1-like esterase